MPTYNCQYGNCGMYGGSEEMITVTGGGFREKYCSWLHAALGCLHRLYPANFNTYWAALAQRAEKQLEECHKHFNPRNPNENLIPKGAVGQ